MRADLDLLVGPDTPLCVARDCPACSIIGESISGCPAHKVEGGPVRAGCRPPLAVISIDASSYRRQRAAAPTANSVCSVGHVRRFAAEANDQVRAAQAEGLVEEADLVPPVLGCVCNEFKCANVKGKQVLLYDIRGISAACCRHFQARQGDASAAACSSLLPRSSTARSSTACRTRRSGCTGRP